MVQSGTLIFEIKNFNRHSGSENGYYFIVRSDNDCLRFSEEEKELILSLNKSENDDKNVLSLQLYVFQRFPPKNKSDTIKYQGRRRRLIDYTELSLNDIPVSTFRESYIDWENVVIKFDKIGISCRFDVEYYPSTPIVPDRDRDNPYFLVVKKQIKPPTLQRRKATEQQQQLKSSTRSKQIRMIQNTKSRKFNKFKQFSEMISHVTKPKLTHRVENSGTDTDIWINLDEKTNQGEAEINMDILDYKHGSNSIVLFDLERDDLTMDESVIYNAVSKKEKYYEENERHNLDTRIEKDEILSLENIPSIFFGNMGNKLNYNEQLDFTSIFTPMNVKVTGYIGNGKWENTELYESLMNWYLQRHIKSLDGPKLPPKYCPRNILWEEYYLMEKDVFQKQYFNVR